MWTTIISRMIFVQIRNWMVWVSVLDKLFLFNFCFCLNCSHSHHECNVSYHRKKYGSFPYVFKLIVMRLFHIILRLSWCTFQRHHKAFTSKQMMFLSRWYMSCNTKLQTQRTWDHNFTNILVSWTEYFPRMNFILQSKTPIFPDLLIWANYSTSQCSLSLRIILTNCLRG